jgi:hypothetical protein
MLLTLRAALPVLLKVMVCEALATPTAWFPKLRLVGDRLTTGLVPVPERLTVCGLPLALSVKVMAAVKDPLATGVKVTLMAQLAPAATLVPQLLLCAKSPGLAPVMVMLVMVNAALPELVNVTDWAVLVVPTAWLPKARLVVDRLAEGCPTPVPANEMLRGSELELLRSNILPVTLPLTTGAKLTLNVVCWLGVRVTGNTSSSMLKPAPRTAACVILTLRVPVLVTVSARVLVVPTATLPKLRLERLKLSCG